MVQPIVTQGRRYGRGDGGTTEEVERQGTRKEESSYAKEGSKSDCEHRKPILILLTTTNKSRRPKRRKRKKKTTINLKLTFKLFIPFYFTALISFL
jgi:hypothetical protein